MYDWARERAGWTVFWTLPLGAVVSAEWNKGCRATPAYSSSCDRICELISMAIFAVLGKSKSWMSIVAN